MFILTTFLLYNVGQFDWNRIGGVMVSELDSSEIACELSSGRVKPKTTKLVFPASPFKKAALRRKSKNWLTQNQDNVSEWSDMSTCRLLFQ